MDWNRIRTQWQSGSGKGPVRIDDGMLDALRKRERLLSATVRRRDWLESGIALLIAPIFAFAAWRAGLREAWWPMFFSVWLTLWVAYVPWHFWRVRRRMPRPEAVLPLHDYLRQQRAAMLAQARMLEQVWLWYLAPCAIGVIGLNFAAQGATTGNFIYAAIVLAFCAFLARLNRRAARTQFRDLAAQIDRQLEQLAQEHQP